MAIASGVYYIKPVPKGGFAWGEMDLIVSFWAKRLVDGDFDWKAPIAMYGVNQGFYVEKSTDSSTSLRAAIYDGSYYLGGYGTIPLNTWTHVLVSCFPSWTQYNPRGQIDILVNGTWYGPSVVIPSGWSNMMETPSALELRSYAGYWNLSDITIYCGTYGNASGTYYGHLSSALRAGRTPASDPWMRNNRGFVVYLPCRQGEPILRGYRFPEVKQIASWSVALNNDKPPAVKLPFYQPDTRVYSVPATLGLFRRIGMDGGMSDLTAGLRG